MDKAKLSFYFLILISITIAIYALICKGNDNCCQNFEINESRQVTNKDLSYENKHYEEMRKKFHYYTLNLKDSIQKQDSIYIEELKEIARLIQMNKKIVLDSNTACICPKKITYEFSYHSYHKIQQKISILQKNISSRNINIKTQDELTEFIIQDSSTYKKQ